MSGATTRRRFLGSMVGSASAALAGSYLALGAPQSPDRALGAIPPLATVSGRPRERGREYGRRFRDGIAAFLEREIYGAFLDRPSPRDELLAYAAACGGVIRFVCPIIHDELEGVAEGSGIALEEIVLLTLHEELYHRGVLPKVGHCTAVAVGPPETCDGATYVGQTWDWMQSAYGLSSMLEWRRGEGPSVLAYGYPGLWVGAGVNAAGVALCWTSAGLGEKGLGVRVGLPSYVLLTHLLYQESLDAALEEARRDRHAGWFTFVVGDAEGNLANVEGSPQGVVIERGKGRLMRVGFGSKGMASQRGSMPEPHDRCEKLAALLDGTNGRTDRAALQGFFQEPGCGISVGKATIDMMVFDTVERRAYLSRGPSYGVDWRGFSFGELAAPVAGGCK